MGNLSTCIIYTCIYKYLYYSCIHAYLIANYIYIYIYIHIACMHACIHVSCIYSFSRKLIWLNVGPTNNKPSVIANYFTDSVLHLKGLILYYILSLTDPCFLHLHVSSYILIYKYIYIMIMYIVL